MPVTRERNPRGEGLRLRDDLLAAAVALVSEHGTLDRVSLRAVATRAGVSPTAVYRHFADHDDLVEAALDACWAEFIEAIEIPDDGRSAIDRFREMGDRYIEFAMREPGSYRVMFSRPTDAHASAGATAAPAFRLLVEVVSELLEANRDDRDPVFVSLQVNAWIHGIVDLARHRDLPWPSFDELLDELAVRLELVAREGS